MRSDAEQQATPRADGVPVSTDAEVRLSALQGQQTALIDRLVRLEGDRVGVVRELSSATGESRRDLITQLRDLDRAIANTKAVIEDQHQKIAELGQPSVTVPPPVQGFQPAIPIPREPGYFGLSKDEMGIGASLVLLFPLSVAIAIRMVRRASRRPMPQTESVESTDRMARLEHAVDAIALEVERISEGQRFTTKLLSEGRAESASVAREGVSVER